MVQYTSQIFIDESGTARHTPYVVYGALKIGTDIGLVVNELEHLRSSTGMRKEARFSDTNKTTFEYHKAIVDTIHASRSRFSALIVVRANDQGGVMDQWRSQAFYSIEVAKYALSDQERTSLVIDHVSVPRDVNYESYIHKAINEPYGESDRRVVSVFRMASEACWGLQAADLMTGAVHFAHRLDQGDKELNPTSWRGLLMEHVRSTFNVASLSSAQSPRFKTKELFKP